MPLPRHAVILLCSTLLLPLIGCNSTSPRDGSLTSGSLQQLWQLDVPSAYEHLLDENLIVGASTQYNGFLAVDVEGRRVAWMSTRGASIGRFLGASSSYVYATTDLTATNPALVVLDRMGHEVNEISLPVTPYGGGGNSGPEVVGNRLYLTHANQLFVYETSGLTRSDAQPAWSKTFTDVRAIRTKFVDENGTVYVSHYGAKLEAYDRDGNLLWTQSTKWTDAPNLMEAHILRVYGDTLVATVGRGVLQAFDRRTGAKRWNGQWPTWDTCPTGGASGADGLEVGDGKAFVNPGGGSCVVGFDLNTGKAIWRFQAPNHLTFQSTPTYLRGVLYTTNTRLFALDANTGHMLAKAPSDILHTAAGGQVQYDAARDQLLVWGQQLVAYKPLR